MSTPASCAPSRRSVRKEVAKAATTPASDLPSGSTGSNSCSVPATPSRRYPRARRVRFYRNGDQFFKGVWYALALDRFRTFDALLEDLNRALGHLVNLPHGVRCIFTLDGQRVDTLSDFEDGQSYVCSSNECFKRIDYANVREPVWYYGYSASGLDGGSSTRSSLLEPNDFVYPRIVTILRNGIKPRRVIRHLLNKRTARSFEQVLSDLSAIVRLDSGAVKKLFTLDGKQVCGLADLFLEDEVFLACGSERVSLDDLYLDSAEYQFLMPGRVRMTRPIAAAAAAPKMMVKADRAQLSQLNEKFLNSRNYQNRMVEKPRRLSPKQADSTEGRQPPVWLPVELRDRFDWGQLLGDGNFAVVHECKHRQTGLTYAVKVIDKRKYRNKEVIDNEVRLLSRISHENVVRLHDSIALKDTHLLVLEFVPGGDLFDALVAAKKFDEACAARMMKNLMSALCHLHEMGIVHRDVKPENLLVFELADGSKQIKLADFGLATELSEPLFEICGTPTYVAPEMLVEEGYGFKVDVWAAGVILFIMLCGYTPFVSKTGDQEGLFEAILLSKYSFDPEYWRSISYAAKMLVNGMLQANADDRYSASEALSHPWIEGGGTVDPDFEHVSSLAMQCVDTVERESRCAESALGRFHSRRRSMDELSCLSRDVSSTSFF